VLSVVSRLYRVTELRAAGVRLDALAQRFVDEAASRGEIRIIANHPDARDPLEYERKEQEQRACNHIPSRDPVLFLEVTVRDPSEFAPLIEVQGESRHGYRILTAEGASVPNTIAAFLVHVRDTTGKVPHAYFAWSEGKPLEEVLAYVLMGEGDVPPVTHEILRAAEPDPERRPVVHVA
jgi:hypothetical protein